MPAPGIASPVRPLVARPCMPQPPTAAPPALGRAGGRSMCAPGPPAKRAGPSGLMGSEAGHGARLGRSGGAARAARRLAAGVRRHSGARHGEGMPRLPPHGTRVPPPPPPPPAWRRPQPHANGRVGVAIMVPAALSICCPLKEMDAGWLVNLNSRSVTEAHEPRLTDYALTANTQHPHMPPLQTPQPPARRSSGRNGMIPPSYDDITCSVT